MALTYPTSRRHQRCLAGTQLAPGVWQPWSIDRPPDGRRDWRTESDSSHCHHSARAEGGEEDAGTIGKLRCSPLARRDSHNCPGSRRRHRDDSRSSDASRPTRGQCSFRHGQLALRGWWKVPGPSGIECLTILVDNDKSGTGQRAALECAGGGLWRIGKSFASYRIPLVRDFNDVVSRGAA